MYVCLFCFDLFRLVQLGSLKIVTSVKNLVVVGRDSFEVLLRARNTYREGLIFWLDVIG